MIPINYNVGLNMYGQLCNNNNNSTTTNNYYICMHIVFCENCVLLLL